jgi:TonB-linked SusC/RagA family outer membrane protein
MLNSILSKGLLVILSALLSLGIFTRAQAQQVSGTVIAAGDEYSLPGVNIIVQGTDIGTVTDGEGNYELTVPSLNETLVFSYVGFQTQSIPIDGRTTIDVEMQSLYIEGGEMVVTAFGIQREARSLSYSTVGVSTETISEARDTNIMNSLQGRVGGMSITQASSGVGAPTRVVLRGNRSISGDSQPLYVVDGVPVRGNPQDLNPDDIASIDVLKGPNAAALYGSAAQNGAIVIETHRGRAGVVNVSLSNNFTVSQANILTEYQNEYGQGTAGSYSPSSEFSWGPRMEGQQVAFWTPNPAHPMAGQTYSMTPQPDNVSDVFRTGYNNASNLTAQIGGERTQTVFSYTYTSAQGIMPENDLQRNNISLRVSSDLHERLRLDSRVSYMRQNIDNPLPQGENFANPLRNTYRMPRNIQTQHFKEFEYTDIDGNLRQHYFNPGSNGGNNPYWVINRNLDFAERERVIAMARLDFEIHSNLNLMVRASYDGLNTENETRRYNDSYVIAQNGFFAVSQGNQLEWNGDFLLSFQDDLTQDWMVSASVGGNIKQQRNESVSSNTTSNPGMTLPNFFALSNTQNVASSHNIGSPMDIHSLYAFGQIGWRDAVYVDFTARNDWSSTLPADNRSYFYPSVGLTAVLSDLISMPEVISLARIRASYAQVGSSAPPFQLVRTAGFSAGGRNGFITLSGTLPAENLRPEQTDAFEIGADIRFFQGRLGFDISAYQTNTTDQLFTVALPVGSGASQFFTNGGDIENKGIEIAVNTTPVQGTNLNWDFNLNFGLNRNMVVAIDDERPRLNIGSDFLRDAVIEEGQPFGEVYSRGYVRDNQGRIQIDPDTGLPLITAGKSVRAANFQPDWIGGISSRLSYRSWNVGFVISHRQGGTISSLSNAVTYADGLTKQTLEGRDGGLIFGQNFMTHETAVYEGTDTAPTTPFNAEDFWRAVGGRNAPAGEIFQESATNTRLRELTIGYSFPESIMENLPVSNVTLSLVGRNLFFIYRESDHIDPDLMVGTSPAAEGFESFTLPTTRTFGANIKIDF